MRATTYFRTNRQYFWYLDYDADTDSIIFTLDDDSTLAYYDQLTPIMESLVLQGLPPFGALLLMVAATNQNGSVNLAEIEDCLLNYYSKLQEPQQWKIDTIKNTKAYLDIFQTLPHELRLGYKRNLLMQALFQDCHSIYSKKNSEELLEFWHSKDLVGLPYTDPNPDLPVSESGQGPFEEALFLADFRVIELIQRKFPDVKSILKAVNSLPDLPAEEIKIDEDIVPKENSKTDFISELMEDEATFHVGSLVKHIWAGIKLPFFQQTPTDQRLGGVADIANKGDFSRLLVSEFANDDQTFMSRLANNEALYLRKEPPPASDKHQRIVIIDSTLRMWGTPRTLAHAFALAIAKHPKAVSPPTIFVVGNDFKEIKYDTLNDVVQALMVLDGSLSPAKGMEKFFAEYPLKSDSEIFFATQKKNILDNGVQKIIAEQRRYFRYWIDHTETGQISIFRSQRSGSLLLQEINLPLEELWKTELRTKKKESPDTGEVIKWDYENCPLYYPIPKRENVKLIAIDYKNFYVAINRGKILFRVSPSQQENSIVNWMSYLYNDMPSPVSHYAVGKNNEGQELILCFNKKTTSVFIVNLSTKTKERMEFPAWNNDSSGKFTYFNNEFVYLVNSQEGYRFDPKAATEPTKFNSTDVELREIYEQHIPQINNNHYSTNFGCLQSSDTLYINNEGILVFNKHHINSTWQSHLQMMPIERVKRTVSIKAKYSSQSKSFNFPNGSKVISNSLGLYKFVSQRQNNKRYCLFATEGLTWELLKKLMNMAPMNQQAENYSLYHDSPNLLFSSHSKTNLELFVKNHFPPNLKYHIREDDTSEAFFMAVQKSGALSILSETHSAGNENFFADKSEFINCSLIELYHRTILPFIEDIIDYGTGD